MDMREVRFLGCIQLVRRLFPHEKDRSGSTTAQILNNTVLIHSIWRTFISPFLLERGHMTPVSSFPRSSDSQTRIVQEMQKGRVKRKNRESEVFFVFLLQWKGGVLDNALTE